MDKFESIRQSFPVTERYVYLNNAAIAPVPPFVSIEAARILEGYGACGGELESVWHERIAGIRKQVAELIGARPAEIFFTKNTSEGLILAARGFPWREGDNVVTLQGEFPAVTVPLHLLSARDVELRLVEPGPDNTYSLKDIESAMDSSTRMLMVSFVEFHTGYRNDLAALGELCYRKKIFFAVDGVQGVGALRSSVSEWGVDLFSAGGHKWLLAGEGTGFCYLSTEKFDFLEPVNCSWFSLENPLDFLSRAVSEASFDKPLRHDARRFEGGTLNIAGIMALGKSVETMLDLGLEEIQERILSLGARAVEGLKNKGYRVISPQQKDYLSGITCFRSEKLDNREIRDSLAQRRICTGFPCGSIRISPHYYNNKDDIDSLLEALPES